jgi:HK97 family phage major capsid protein
MYPVIDNTLNRFQSARQQARRFHVDTIGDVDVDKCFGDWLLCIKGKRWDRLEKVYKAALSSTSGTTGGYTVPTDFLPALYQTIEEQAIIRPRALVCPMASSSMILPLPDATTAQAANTAPYFGGILLQWTEESALIGETEPTFRSVTLRAWTLAGYALTSNNLLHDGGKALESLLYLLFGRSIAWYEDYAFLVGDGVAKPNGFLNAKSALTVARNTSSHAKLVDCATMLSLLLPSSWPRAIWVMHPSVFIDIFQLSGTAGGAGYQSNQPNEPALIMPAGSIGPCPAFISDKVPPLGTKGDLMLIDPGLYVIGDRQTIDVAVSDQMPTPFAANQSAWRVTHRVDGQSWLNNPVTLADGSKQASNAVILV